MERLTMKAAAAAAMNAKASQPTTVEKKAGAMGLAELLIGLGVVGVPAAVGSMGYVGQLSRNNIERDKEFEGRKRKLRFLSQANNELATEASLKAFNESAV